jgi:putative tricarboxylic transport membrane protein
MVLENIMFGLSNVFQPFNILMISLGTIIGIFVGAMPGLSATMAIALLLPLTFSLDAAAGLSMLAALYMGAMYGGSISAILIKTPGTPAAAATVLDGYPMAQKGQAGRALGISLVASLVGGVISSLALLLVAPILGALALEFGPLELLGVAVLGITIIGSLSGGSVFMGLLSGVFGLLLSQVGIDPITGSARFTFGNINLYSGIPFVVALIGLFSIPQAIKLVSQKEQEATRISKFSDKMLPTWKEFVFLVPTIIRSAVIGIFVGLVPGTGGDTACWFAYNETKRFSKRKELFGTGLPEGIAAAEAANNAVVGGALIPTISLGIPGSSATAVLMGGLMVHGMMPGPTLMTDYAKVTYTLIWAVLLSNLAMFIFGLLFTRASIVVTRVRNKVLGPIIVVLCVIGAFAINNSVFDVGLMFAFGLLGYFMDKIKMPVAPMVLGLILGNLMSTSYYQTLMIGHGSLSILLKSPIAMVLLTVALLSILQATPLFSFLRKKKKQE